jgi:hypothetical protein
VLRVRAGRTRNPRLLTESRRQPFERKASLAETRWSLRPPGAQAVAYRDESPPPPSGRPRNPGSKRLRCSFCQAELGEGLQLTIPASGAQGRRGSTSSFCSTHCRDCVRALAALHPSPLASSDFIAKRMLLTDRLLDLWRHRRGPDPVLVLQAAEAASNGLKLAAAI